MHLCGMETLFLDRDGVINRRLPGDYVRSPLLFEFLPGVLDALPRLSVRFGRIVVVTNQAGIGKGLMTLSDLERIHREMRLQVEGAGGRLDAIYFCPHAAMEGCPCRKPATGMGWQALADFPDIDFETSWMVGDSVSDLEFGAALGMRRVWIRGQADVEQPICDFTFNDLGSFTRFIC
jgi:histidinol-phosphate phosphatase family protein